MGNQAYQPTKGLTSYEPARSRSFMESDHHKNRRIYRKEGQSEFPELPTLGDEYSSIKMSKFQEIQNTRIKASVAKKKKSNMNKSYSIQDFEHSNPSNFTTRTTRIQQNNDQGHSFRNVSQTYRSDQTAYQKRRNQSFCSFAESNNQTCRRFQNNIFSENRPETKNSYDKDVNCRVYKENAEKPQDNYKYSKERMNQRFAEPHSTYRHRKNVSCVLETNPNLYREYEHSSPDVSDPIQQYLKRFTAGSHEDQRFSEKFTQINRDSVSRDQDHRDSMEVNRLSPEIKRYPQPNNHNMATQKSVEPQEVCDKQINNLTFEYPGSSNETISSESILYSEPEVNAASQISLEAKRLCNYDIPNRVMLVNHQMFRNEAHGSRNLSSITEFDQDNFAKFHLVDSKPSLNGGLLSRQNIDAVSTKANSTQASFLLNSQRPYTTSERSFSSLNSLEKVASSESAGISDFSTTTSLSNIQTKENEQNRKIQKENYYSNPTIQMTQRQRQPSISLNTPNMLKSDNYRADYDQEMQNQQNFSSQKVDSNLFERIPTVPECVQETDQSMDTFVDTLNRTGELSMMSPTNVESNNMFNFSPFLNQQRPPSPDRDSLRQYVLSQTLKKAPIPAEDMLMYPNQFILNTRNLNCTENGHGIALSHFNSESSTKSSQNSDLERQNRQYVRRYSSAIDCSKKENKFGN